MFFVLSLVSCGKTNIAALHGNGNVSEKYYTISSEDFVCM